MGTRFRQVLCQSLCRTKATRKRLSNLELLRGLANITAPAVNITLDNYSTATDTTVVEDQPTPTGTISSPEHGLLVTDLLSKLRKATTTTTETRTLDYKNGQFYENRFSIIADIPHA